MSQSTDAYVRKEAAIVSGAAVSAAINIIGLGLVGAGVLVPAGWTAADIAFEVSVDGLTWYPVYDETGTRVKVSGISTSESRLYIAPAQAWIAGAFPYMRFVSIDTSTGANKNQDTSDKTLTLVRLAT